MTTPPPPATVETLLAHREWVRALALRLVADPAGAADLEQQTWLRALRSPPSSGEAPRAWLGTVLRNLARDRGRRKARRRRREEAVARPETLPATAELVARAEALGRVVEAVTALDEPYRSTILLRFFEGLPPRDVAARMEVPVETARTRTRRALTRLREDLADVYESEGASWHAALLPLAGLDAAQASPVHAPVSSWSTAGTWALRPTVVVVTAGALWFAADRLTGTDEGVPATPVAAEPDAVPSVAEAPPTAAVDTPPSRIAQPPPTGPAPERPAGIAAPRSPAPDVVPRAEGDDRPGGVRPVRPPPDPNTPAEETDKKPRVEAPVASAPPYEDDDTTAWTVAYDKRLAASAKQFRSLADWCLKNRLEWTSIHVRRRVLRYLPDDAKTRAYLGYERVDGRWVQTEAARTRIFSEFVDDDDPNNAKYGSRYARVQKRVSEGFLGLARKAGRAANDASEEPQRSAWKALSERAWHHVLELMPGVGKHRLAAHDALGHPAVGGERVSHFAAPFARARLARRKAAAATVRLPFDVKEVPLDGPLAKAALKGGSAVSEHFTVNSTHGAAVAARQAGAMERAMFDALAVYGFPAEVRERVSLRVHHGVKDRAEFARALTAAGMAKKDVQRLADAGFGGTDVAPGERIGTSTDGKDAEDGVMNAVTVAMAQAAADFAAQDLGRRMARPEDWLWQSMASDCTKRVLGTAHTVWGAFGDYGKTAAPRPGQDVWIALAREQVELDNDVALERLPLLALKRQEFRGREIVKGYAFLQFLFESDREKARDFIRRALPLGTAHAAMDVWGAEILGADAVPEMPERLPDAAHRGPLPPEFAKVLAELDARYREWIVKAW